MATTYKVLGQSKPAATTATTLYTCPSATQTVISSLVVANQAGTGGTYRIAIRPNGASLSGEHYIAYDAPLAANSFVSLTLGLTIDASDVVTIFSSSADMSFNAFGSEIA
jgi:hypothetical protein